MREETLFERQKFNMLKFWRRFLGCGLGSFLLNFFFSLSQFYRHKRINFPTEQVLCYWYLLHVWAIHVYGEKLRKSHVFSWFCCCCRFFPAAKTFFSLSAFFPVQAIANTHAAFTSARRLQRLCGSSVEGWRTHMIKMKNFILLEGHTVFLEVPFYILWL